MATANAQEVLHEMKYFSDKSEGYFFLCPYRMFKCLFFSNTYFSCHLVFLSIISVIFLMIIHFSCTKSSHCLVPHHAPSAQSY